MSGNNMDKLIPEVFAEMRSNLNQSASRTGAGAGAGATPATGPTTQSLMHELDSLDRILTTVKQLNTSVSGAVATDLAKVHSVCVSSNRLLDAWIGVQSQAGYVHRLMSEPAYISHLKESGAEDTASPFEREVQLESDSVERLKQLVAQEREKQREKVTTQSQARVGSRGSDIKGGATASRIAKPRTTTTTAQSRPVRTRKLFRR
ncbi:Duo1 protein [Maudiozyma humilis]|uniref:DASH complex subunit DUO1 n=1 Tax=Maudiozyma humilis TaxID=51915 RepID=A0AAV5RVC8_MAUHU|nr:Duo1 protein [Kazachstania humilis]